MNRYERKYVSVNNTVSLIIPVYNAKKYLDKCICSVLNQTEVPDEIILVDDGSTDGSSDICNNYAHKYPFIKVIHKKNGGLGFARNSGLDIATCQYISFLDSDDYLDQDFFQILKAAANDGIDIVKSGYRRISQSGQVFSTRMYDREETFTDKDIMKSYIPRMLGSLPDKHDSVEMGVTCSLISRDIIADTRFYSEREYISEDLIFNLEISARIKKIKLIPYIGYNYQENTASLTLKYRKDRFEAICALDDTIKKYIAKLAIGDNAKIRWEKTWLIYLWMTLSQEKYSISNYNPIIQYKHIRQILVHPKTRAIIELFPIDRMEPSKRMFCYLTKYRLAILLLILVQIVRR